MPEIVAIQKSAAKSVEAEAPRDAAGKQSRGKQHGRQQYGKRKVSLTQMKNPLTHEDVELFNQRSRQMLDLFNSTYEIVREEHPELTPDQSASIAQMCVINSTKSKY